jgi:hypothetical protein
MLLSALLKTGKVINKRGKPECQTIEVMTIVVTTCNVVSLVGSWN